MLLEEAREEDTVFEIEKVKFVMGPEEMKEVSYMEIDYVVDWWGEDFVVTTGF